MTTRAAIGIERRPKSIRDLLQLLEAGLTILEELRLAADRDSKSRWKENG